MNFDMIINVPTIEDWIEVVEYFVDKDITWEWTGKQINEYRWTEYKQNSCICVSEEHLYWSHKSSYTNITTMEEFRYMNKAKQLLKEFI